MTQLSKLQQLASLIDEISSHQGILSSAIPGLHLTKLTTTQLPRTTCDRAIFCMVAQGSKSILLRDERFVYDPGKYMMMALDLPLVSEIVAASPETPLLGVSVNLDFTEIAALLLDAGLPVMNSVENKQSLSVNPMTDDLLDVLLRLVGLLKHPAQIPILAPMIRRELFYKLLLSEQSGALRRMALQHSQVSRIAVGLEWLRKNAFKPIRMAELAETVNMSPSTMHVWFKTVTNMSPLQFQKQLRLQEARRLLLTEKVDAATASQRVGYESPSQFSREYRRLFGLPPARDIERLRIAL
jgi:AraC-like DNA-binding protein